MARWPQILVISFWNASNETFLARWKIDFSFHKSCLTPNHKTHFNYHYSRYTNHYHRSQLRHGFQSCVDRLHVIGRDHLHWRRKTGWFVPGYTSDSLWYHLLRKQPIRYFAFETKQNRRQLHRHSNYADSCKLILLPSASSTLSVYSWSSSTLLIIVCIQQYIFYKALLYRARGFALKISRLQIKAAIALGEEQRSMLWIWYAG